MPGRASGSTSLRYVGVAVALVALIGWLALGWEFGGDEFAPAVVGAVAAAVAVGLALYRRFGTDD
jgi:hypothetical protein